MHCTYLVTYLPVFTVYFRTYNGFQVNDRVSEEFLRKTSCFCTWRTSFKDFQSDFQLVINQVLNPYWVLQMDLNLSSLLLRNEIM